ncbi:hypothetical protein N9948_01415, partial [bacterium]|nr:hypothetical protein [bacterium]
FIEILEQFPSAFFNNLSSCFEVLAKKQNDCVIQVEQYSLETTSRYEWKSRKNYLLNSHTQTGIIGTDSLGINQFQKYWSVLNIREDEKDSFEENYSLFKFLASFHDPKSVRKIEEGEKVKKEEEEKRRERMRVMGTEEELQYLSGPTDTREGIIEELEKQMSGEKDDHDRAIEEYEKDIRRSMLTKMRDIQKNREVRRKELGDIKEEAKAITKDELKERLKRLKEKKDNVQYDPEVTPDQSSKFYQMSNIKDQDLIREEDFLTPEDYKKLTGDELYQDMTGMSEEEKKEITEKEYQKQQQKLASKYGLDIDDEDVDMDFPHLNKR